MLRRRILWSCMVCAAMAGCGLLPLYDISEETAFLGVNVSNFSDPSALQARDNALTAKAEEVAMPTDLLDEVASGARIVLSASDVTVTIDNESARTMASSEPTEYHAQVTFHLGPEGTDACASEDTVGPFELTIINDVVTIELESLDLAPAIEAKVRNGKIELCAEAWASFDGSISIGVVSIEFGDLPPNEDKVEICHIPADDPDNQHSITVASSAVEAHLAHGDYLGPCVDQTESNDSDGDGVANGVDQCADTPSGAVVDASGCSCVQRDGDADGVNDCSDLCPNSADSTIVDASGCEPTPETKPDADTDGDGVLDESDLCPDTVLESTVDENGCSCDQLDDDGDGVPNCDDLCPETPATAIVDETGCHLPTADAGEDVTLDEILPVTLQGSAAGGTPPYTYAWSAPEWDGSFEQNPTVVPTQTTIYTLTVTDWSFPPSVVTDTMTITVNTHDDLQYDIVNIGSLSNQASYPAGINDTGDVVGYYYTDAWLKRAFVYSSDTMTDLGTLGGAEAWARDINNNDQVVGQALTVDGNWHAFIWDSANGMRDLGTLGGSTSVAYAINDVGQIAGYSYTSASIQAFIYDSGVMTNIGSEDYLQSGAFDINDAGQAAGTLAISGSNPSAFLYDGTGTVDLGSPLLDASRAWSINNDGLIAGYSWGGGQYHSFLYADGAVVDLGELTGFPEVYAWSIGDTGQIVGSVTSTDGTVSHAFVYTGGQLRDLNDLLASGHGWDYLTVAFAVNGSGQITGYGQINGLYRGFIMTPQK